MKKNSDSKDNKGVKLKFYADVFAWFPNLLGVPNRFLRAMEFTTKLVFTQRALMLYLVGILLEHLACGREI